MKQINRFDTYIKGEQTNEELDAFTKDILGKYYKEKALKDKWGKLLAQDQELLALKATRSLPEKKSISPFIKIASMAASICLIIGSWLVYQHFSIPEATRLANTYLAESYDPIQLRKGTVEDLRMIVNQHFEAQDYKSAIPILTQINQQAATVEDFFLLGFAYLKTGEWNKAITNFEIVLDDPTQLKREQAIWFAGLAHIKANQPALAIEKLQLLASRKGWKNKEAIRLIAAIEAQ